MNAICPMKTVKQKMKEISNSITNDIVNDNRFFILIYRKSYSIFQYRREGRARKRIRMESSYAAESIT